MDALKELLTAQIEAGPMKLVTWEILYVIVLVLVLSWILNRFLFQPVLAVLDERGRRISQAAGTHEDVLQEVEAKTRERADRLAAARRDALDRVEKAKGEAEKRRRDAVAAAREQAEGQLAAAQARVEGASREAEAELRRQGEGLARQVASAVLGREVA